MNTVLGATVPYKENIYVASATIVDISGFYLILDKNSVKLTSH